MQMENIEQIRVRARGLAARAKGDQGLREQLRRFPETTLFAAGIPTDLADEFLGAIGIEADVIGYAGPIKGICILTELL